MQPAATMSMQRVPVGELVEVHVVDGRAVDLRFGIGKKREERQRMLARRRGQRRVAYPRCSAAYAVPACSRAVRGIAGAAGEHDMARARTRPKRRARKSACVEAAKKRGHRRPVGPHRRKLGEYRRRSAGSASTIAATNMSPAMPPDEIEMDRERCGGGSAALSGDDAGRHTVLRG